LKTAGACFIAHSRALPAGWVDGMGTDWLLWTLAFGLTFIATVPLHIMHKQIPSMLSELITQIILIYGSWAVFVAG
jgi:hypothetical protein